MSRMGREELVLWLQENEVEFPKTATLRHLRSLYESTRGAVGGAQGGTPEDEQSQLSDDELDLELRALEKRRKILALRRQLEEEERQLVRQPEVKDVIGSIIRFSGGDTCDANRWLAEFESTCDALGGDDTFKLRCIRQLMEAGTEAEWFLRVDNSVNFREFRTSFLENFGYRYSVAEVIDKLRKTTFEKSKMSVTGYILRMQEIASRVNIEESQVVQLIIDGFQDRTANVAVLYPARNLADLKKLSRRYAQLRDMYPTQYLPRPVTQKPRLEGKGDATRCYNCSGIGHLSVDCKEPRRAKGSCFRCGSTQHRLKECPKPAPRNSNQVALVEDFRRNTGGDSSAVEEATAVLSELNIVSIAFSNDINTQQCNTVVSLFDTGSPINFVRRSLVSPLCGSREKTDSGFKSIGNHPLCTYGIVTAVVTFRNRKTSIKVHVKVVSHCMTQGLLKCVEQTPILLKLN